MNFGVVNAELLKGFMENIELFAVTLIFSLPLGLIISFGSMTRFSPVRFLTKGFVWAIRGTPLMLQLFVVMYMPGLVFGWQIPGSNPRMTAAAIAFIINYACYFSEIFRGGIESIPKGQYEAGQVLGMTKSQVFFKVVLMQVVKRIIAPMSNEVITLVKDTALARVIMIVEIIQAAQNYAAYGLMWPLFYTAVFYLVFVGVLTILFGYFERKLSYYKV